MVPDFHFASIICTENVSPRVNRELVTYKYSLHQKSYTNKDIHVLQNLQNKKMLYANKRYSNWKVGS